MPEYRVMMTIDNDVIPSSCVYVGTKDLADTVAGRLNNQQSCLGWVVLPYLTDYQLEFPN